MMFTRFGECEWVKQQTMHWRCTYTWRNLNGKSGKTLPAVGVPWLQGSSDSPGEGTYNIYSEGAHIP